VSIHWSESIRRPLIESVADDARDVADWVRAQIAPDFIGDDEAVAIWEKAARVDFVYRRLLAAYRRLAPPEEP
jgi:hypothetical protein